jgi:cytochrome c oxidase subunit 2
MLLRVYVEPRDVFERWLREQQKPASSGDGAQASEAERRGRNTFETTACINCHAVAGTVANGRFGPDLTHLMSRETIASGIAPNTPENLRRWIEKPDSIKLGSRMPAMQLSDREYDNVVAYLLTLR